MTFGQKLRRLRKDAHLTQEELGRAIGHAGQTKISEWERDVRYPSDQNIKKLAAALSCTTAELLEGVPTREVRLRSPVSHSRSDDVVTDFDWAWQAVGRELPQDYMRAELRRYQQLVKQLKKARTPK